MAVPEVRWLLRPKMELQAVARWFSCRVKLGDKKGLPAPDKEHYLCPGFNPQAMSVETQCRDRCWQGNYESLLSWINAVLARTFPEAASVVVVEWLHSYRPPHERPTFRVEVLGKPSATVSPRAQIVKIALPQSFDLHAAAARRSLERPAAKSAAKLKAELTGYSRIFNKGSDVARPVFAALSKGYQPQRGAVYSVKYNDAEDTLRAVDNVVSLERAVIDACKGGQPSLESIDSTLVQLFTAMEDAFYRHTWPERDGETKRSERYLIARLREGIEDWLPAKKKTATNNAGQEAKKARDEVIWALRDPDWQFVDPVLYFSAEKMPPTPEMLLGMSHGDLHARNVLVGLVEGEARWPILFDYEDVTCCNLVAWDFAKLETELKKVVLADPSILPADNDAEFIRKLYEFEVGLCERAERSYNHNHWPSLAHGEDAIAPADGKLPGGSRRHRDTLSRFAHILLTVRRMAWKCLELERRRSRKWLHEYYFTLAAYGVFATRFPVFREVRPLKTLFVGAGVAAYRHAFGEDFAARMVRLREIDARDWLALPGAPQAAASTLEGGQPKGNGEPWVPEEICTHQGDLAFAKKLARSRQPEQVKKAIEILRRLMCDHPFVLEPTYECVLALLEMAQFAKPMGDPDADRQRELTKPTGDANADAQREAWWDEADRLLCRAMIRFRTEMHEELLCRAGRLAKDQADYWVEKKEPKKARWLYREAAKRYGEATKARGGHYYPAVNEATCLLLAGQYREACEKASAVLARVKAEERKLRSEAESNELMWVLASKGEALIVAGGKNWRRPAERAYREAMEVERTVDQSKQVRDTIFHQLCRIHRALQSLRLAKDAKQLKELIAALE